ncbi:MAG: 16S rRNA (cytosine(1402)-N(4))-methyltransferase RsmH [Clostridia bacterium]|nr:16S rRNA (cytosine(1402)-N(4))-methyltransferase RsmH [Clostridia bacterium]
MEFNHYPVMLSECIEGLNIKEDGIYVDGTLGGAGHSSEILKKLKSGKLIAIDKDLDAINSSRDKLNKISNNFTIVHSDFKNFTSVLNDLQIDKVDGILLDLGVSSYQLDNAERGFSYISDGNLDMRMNKEQEFSAFNVVNEYSYEELSRIIWEYGDERFSRKIASNIIRHREKAPITTTKELVSIIEEVYPSKIKNKGGSVAKKTFQAIRIEVNGELNRLKEVLYEMVDRLNIGGRICVITFHSLEDKIVKHAFKDMSVDCICPPNAIVCVCNHPAKVKLITRKATNPSDKEIEENKRSHSAKLRIIEKL